MNTFIRTIDELESLDTSDIRNLYHSLSKEEHMELFAINYVVNSDNFLSLLHIIMSYPSSKVLFVTDGFSSVQGVFGYCNKDGIGYPFMLLSEECISTNRLRLCREAKKFLNSIVAKELLVTIIEQNTVAYEWLIRILGFKEHSKQGSKLTLRREVPENVRTGNTSCYISSSTGLCN